MSTRFYLVGLEALLDGTIDWGTSTLKLMLLQSSYTFDPDHDTVSDLSGSEVSVSGYTGGFNGAGRKSATCTLEVNTTNDRIELKVADLTWTGLAAGETIGGAALIFESTDDAGSTPVIFFDFTDTATNGGDFTLDFDATDGNMRIAV